MSGLREATKSTNMDNRYEIMSLVENIYKLAEQNQKTIEEIKTMLKEYQVWLQEISDKLEVRDEGQEIEN